MTLTSNGNGKDLVSYTGVPTVPPPPPPPTNFTLEFKNLVKDFDTQCYGFEALQAEYEKRDRPVLEVPRDFETYQSGYGYISRSAKHLLEKLQAFWPEENIHHHASHDAIAMRLGLMAERLPKGDQQSDATAEHMCELVEAELPSIMVLETTCREFEADTKPYPLPGQVLPVLRKHKEIWQRRMEAVDIELIEELSDEYTAARQKQHAILEKALRERLASTMALELLALLDADKRVDECVHYVAAIANLHQENCAELADKLQQDFETYQRLSNVDEDDDNSDAWSQAESKARQTYEEAGPVIEKKRSERESAERLQAYEEHKRQRKKEEEERRWKEEERRFVEEQWLEEQAKEQLHEEMCNAMERAELEYWAKIARDDEYDPWTAEVIAEVQKNGIPRLSEKERAERRAKEEHVKLLRDVQAMQEQLMMELKGQREYWQEYSWNQLMTMLPEIMQQLNEQEERLREVQDRLRDLESDR